MLFDNLLKAMNIKDAFGLLDSEKLGHITPDDFRYEFDLPSLLYDSSLRI